MFDSRGRSARKPRGQEHARKLRREGWSYKRIAAELGISPSSALNWTRDIKLTDEQIALNLGKGTPAARELVHRRARAWSDKCRQRRLALQEKGRQRARAGDALHHAGCMLYWAEGAKDKNRVKFCNSDVAMVAFFRRFMSECLGVAPAEFAFSLHVYLGNGLSIAQIEDHWLALLGLPRTCLRKHAINPRPTSSSGKKRNRLPYGVGTLSYGSTEVVQHIFGAIQEYAGFEEPRWLG